MQPANARTSHATYMHRAPTSQHSPHSRLPNSADVFPSLAEAPQEMTRQGPVSTSAATPPKSTNPPYLCGLHGWETTVLRQPESAVAPAQATFLASMKGMTQQRPGTRTASPARALNSPFAAALINRTGLGRIRPPERAAVHVEGMLVAGLQGAAVQHPNSTPALLTVPPCPPLFVGAPRCALGHGAEHVVLTHDHNTMSHCYCFECFDPLPVPGAMFCSNCKHLVSDRLECNTHAAYPLLIAGLEGVTGQEPYNMPLSSADAAPPMASNKDGILQEVSAFKDFHSAPTLVLLSTRGLAQGMF